MVSCRLLVIIIMATTPGARAQLSGGDIRSLAVPDFQWTYPRFTARAVGTTGECFVQQGGSNVIHVYATVDAWRTGAASTRTFVFADLTPATGAAGGSQMVFVNGSLYATPNNLTGALPRVDALTGAPIPTSISSGSSSVGWGGFRSLIGCDGVYFYNHKDALLEIYDLNETLLRTTPMPASLNAYSTSFAAGGYYYPQRWPNGETSERVDAATGVVEAWSDSPAGGCDYLTNGSYDYVFDRLLMGTGNSTCPDRALLFLDVLIGGVRLRTVDAAPLRVAPGQGGYAVTLSAENVGAAPLDVTSIALAFRDGAGVDRSSEYVVTAAPSNPTAIAVGATELFAFDVALDMSATIGTITIDGVVQTFDAGAWRAFGDLGADVVDTWEVTSGQLEIRTVAATPSLVAPGSAGHAVSVTIANPGLNSVAILGVVLTFQGSIDRSAEYMVTPTPGNPTLIAAGATVPFGFTVDVDPLAALEVIDIDATATAADTATAAILVDAAADVIDQWTVVACAVIACGDCTGDGVTTILDALRAAQHAVGAITLAGAEFSACNVVGAVEPAPAAAVDILDALVLAQVAAGLTVTLACC